MRSLILCTILCWFSTVTLAQWSRDGNAVSVTPFNQSRPMSVSDGAGGAIITWACNDGDIYAQRLDSNGVALWKANGVIISQHEAFENNPAITSDNAGGAIITWENSYGYRKILAQRINANGVVQWAANGVVICPLALNHQAYPVIISDNAGGAIIAWSDERNGQGRINTDIYAQRISASGVVQWATDGVAICTASDGQTEPAITNNLPGGAIIAWTDYRNNGDPNRTINTDIYAQRTSGLRANLTFYHQLPDIPYFRTPFVIAASGRHAKICADGSSATLISYKVDSGSVVVGQIKLRIKEEPQGDATSVYGSFALDPLLSFPPDSLVFRYTHPKTPPPSSSLSRQITLEVVDPSTGIAKKSNSIDIYRAPVLMVHGFTGYPSTYDKMKDSLVAQGWPKPLLYQANYKPTNARSYSINDWVLPLYTNMLLTQARISKYSAGKVDVVGHSMGGILARLYLQGYKYQHNLNRLITISTPHSGSQWANLVLEDEVLGHLVNLLVPVYEGAVSDLQVGKNNTIWKDLNGDFLNYRVVPSHAILAEASPSDVTHIGLIDYLIRLLGPQYRLPLPTILSRLFNGEPNDLVVSISSQQGGLSNFGTASFHLPHGTATEDTAVINRLIQLLNTSSDDLSTFSTSGFHPPLLEPTFHGGPFFVKPNLASNLNGTVTITSPPNGTTVAAGQTQPVSIVGSGDITSLVFAAGNSSMEIYSDQQNSPSATFDYPVPQNAVGLIKILAVGFTDSGYAALDSISLKVVVTATLDSLPVYPRGLYLPAGQSLPISVSGAYHDGIKRYLRLESGVSFECSDANIAGVPEPYVIAGLAEGKTTVIVRYRSRMYTLPVSVLAVNAWTTSVDNGTANGKTLPVPKEYLLRQNYPNPFNPSTTIRYAIPRAGYVTLKVYNVLGKEIAILVHEQRLAGKHEIRWNPVGLPSGIYFCQLRAGDTSSGSAQRFVATRKLLLVK